MFSWLISHHLSYPEVIIMKHKNKHAKIISKTIPLRPITPPQTVNKSNSLVDGNILLCMG